MGVPRGHAAADPRYGLVPLYPGALARVASLTVLAVLALAASTSAAPSPRFDRNSAMTHIRKLALDIGVRAGGSARERAAADYIAARMVSWGYTATRQDVPLPTGRITQNLVFDKPGTADWTLTLGAHIDSKPPAPGANDNASGVATLLELAHAIEAVETRPTLRFIFFGAEEKIRPDRDEWHHFGSRWYVAHMSTDDRARCGGMICIDTVAGGPRFFIGSMHGKSPLVADLRALSARRGLPAETMNDPGWSDHEPFEDAGFTVAYVRWRVDKTLHTAGDDYRHVRPDKMGAVGDLMIDFILCADTPYPTAR